MEYAARGTLTDYLKERREVVPRCTIFTVVITLLMLQAGSVTVRSVYKMFLQVAHYTLADATAWHVL